MSEKIATKIKIGLTGQTYTIGTTGTKEKVAVKLTAATAVTWTNYSVIVQDLSTSTSATYALNADGECTFEIPMGDRYQVTLPTIASYNQPQVQEYTAYLGSRAINYTYVTTPIQYEQVNIHGSVFTTQGLNNSILEGYIAVATDAQGVLYNGTFNSNGLAQINIPYGKVYTIALPSIPSYGHDNITGTYTAGLVSRNFNVKYQTLTFGVVGVDASGRLYSIEECAALTDKSIIIAGRYNDADLEASSREDGTTGNGFMWLIDNGTTSGNWASINIEFDTARLPFVTSDAIGLTKCAGSKYTSYILAIAVEKRTETAYATLTTTGCTNAQAKTLTIGGVARTGFMPAYGQIRRLALNYSSMQALYTALGKTAPTITSGSWWTSCQSSATYGVNLYTGGFDRITKDYSRSLLVAFDL